MNCEISFFSGDDLLTAIPVNEKIGYAICFIHKSDADNNRKKKRALYWDEKVMGGVEKHIKMQRDYLAKQSGKKLVVNFLEAFNSGKKFRMCNNDIVTEGWYSVDREIVYIEGNSKPITLNSIHFNSQYELGK